MVRAAKRLLLIGRKGGEGPRCSWGISRLDTSKRIQGGTNLSLRGSERLGKKERKREAWVATRHQLIGEKGAAHKKRGVPRSLQGRVLQLNECRKRGKVEDRRAGLQEKKNLGMRFALEGAETQPDEKRDLYERNAQR